MIGKSIMQLEGKINILLFRNVNNSEVNPARIVLSIQRTSVSTNIYYNTIYNCKLLWRCFICILASKLVTANDGKTFYAIRKK